MNLFLSVLLAILTISASFFSSSHDQQILQGNWITHRVSRRAVVDSGVNWALDRLNQVTHSLDGKVDFVANGDVYVVGSGVRATHSELGDRVREGYSEDGSDSREDCGAGHLSTGASSIVGGTNLGLSRDANIIPVKVSCSNSVSYSALSRGLQWIEHQIRANSPHRAVVLIAIPNFPMVPELNTLAQDTLVVVPAGDDAANNCNAFKSLDTTGVVVVASSDINDAQSSHSNYGPCVDIWAPGESVTVASSSSDTEEATRESSTVYAAAAVAGVAIKNLITMNQLEEPFLTKSLITSHSTKGALTLSKAASKVNTVNKLLFDICPYYKLVDHGKCYVAQTKQIINDDKTGMNKVAKSVVTFDNMAYNYYEDCFSVLVFRAPSETSTTVEATHEREGNEIKKAVFTITTKHHTITLASGPTVTIDGVVTDLLSGGYYSPDADDFFSTVLDEMEVNTQDDENRFIPVVSINLPDNVTVSFDGHQEIRLKVDVERYKEKTEGICGFLDNSHVKEFVDRNGNDMEFTFAKNKKEFVTEWKTSDFTCDEPDPICDNEDCQKHAEKVCYPLKDNSMGGQFRDCFERLPPDSWYSNCVDAVTQCCCADTDVGKCACEEQRKYWWAALLEGCKSTPPCDVPCKKPTTDSECRDDAGREMEFFWRDFINYTPKDNCYYVDKHERIMCNHDGTWSDPVSDCKIKTCDVPKLTDFVEFKGVAGDPDYYNCGDEVKFTCTKTECDCNCYSMSGSSSTQCVSDGERTSDWDQDVPHCTLNKCKVPNPPVIDRFISSPDDALSWVVDKDTMDRSCCAGRATYACHECYELDIQEQSCCDGKWGGGVLPTCTLKSCVDPELEMAVQGDPHLVVKYPDTYCSHTLTYSCNSSCYRIEGDTHRTCQADGTWSGSLPTCVKKKCPVLEGFDDGAYSFNGAELQQGMELECGDSVSVHCDSCFWPCASTCDRTCSWDSLANETVWNRDEPQCRPFECEARDVPHATTKRTGPLECGESSTVTCNTCYRQTTGDNTRTCSPPANNGVCPYEKVDGVYSGTEVECEEMICPDLVDGPNIRHNMTCANSFNCDCQAVFECESSCYDLVGSRTLTCDGSGWDDEVPTCVLKTCPFPTVDFARHYNYDEIWEGGCQFVEDGSRVEDSHTFHCGDIIEVEAANSSCYHVCNKDNLLCQDDGTWNVTRAYLPSCMYMECEKPAAVPNAHYVDPGEYNCTSRIHYECDPCYKHVGGDLTRQCVAKDIASSPDGEWSGEAPVCVKIECEAELPKIANATFDISEEDKVCGKKADYKCDDCSRLEGSNELHCNQEGFTALAIWNWATSQQPSCQPICCPELPLFVREADDADYDADGTVTRYTHGPHAKDDVCGDNYVCQEVEAQCDVCFEYKTVAGEVSDSAPTRQCKKQQLGDKFIGAWTNPDKLCTRKECPKRDIPPEHHAHYKTSDMAGINKCNQTVDVECDCCYKLTDTSISETHQCEPTRDWDHALPMCRAIPCPEPVQISNGELTVLTSSDTCSCKTVKYQCDPCFRLVGEAVLTCTQDAGRPTASWSSEPPRCEPICCEPLVEPIDPITHLVSTRLTHVKATRPPLWEYDDMSVKENYEECADNYVCQKVEPECGECFEYTDDDGTNVDGVTHPPQRACEKKLIDGTYKGEWTNKDKYCKLKTCPFREISDSQHLSYTEPEGYDSSSLSHCLSNVTVTCDLCYELSDGSHTETHTCQQDKTWSKDLPTCTRTECPQPPVVPHCTYRSTGSNLCDDTRQLECDECFYEPSCSDRNIDAAAMKEVQCQADKSWSWKIQEPSMKVRTCPDAPPIANGQVNSTGTDCGDMARYSCDTCYKFSHKSDCLCERRKCIPDPDDCTGGMWNETAPTCEKITCPVLDAPANGVLVGIQDSTCGGSVEFACDEGYDLRDGDLVRHCTELGTWTGKQPVCEVVSCTEIGEELHRSQTSTSNIFGAVVTFKCDSCFEFEPEYTDEGIKDENSLYPRFHVLKCEATGNWNGSEPFCREQTCRHPPAIANGKINSRGPFSCKSTVTYSCNEGYQFKIRGSETRKCVDGKLTGPEPECVPIDCGEPDTTAPLYADLVQKDKTTYQHGVEYECGNKRAQKRCYDQSHLEQDRFTCQADGFWEVPEKECKWMQCDETPIAENGVYEKLLPTKSVTDCNQRLKLKCDEGYALKTGKDYIKCQEVRGKMKWYPSRRPECEKMTCFAQSSPIDGFVSPTKAAQIRDNVYHGDSISYACKKCYELDGASTRECITHPRYEDRATWSVSAPTCSQMECYHEPIVTNGDIMEGNAKSRPVRLCGSKVTFTCDFGYKLVGSATSTCVDNGNGYAEWDTVFPTCEEIVCPEPAPRDHMTSYTNADNWVYRLYDTITYECMSKYFEMKWEDQQTIVLTCQEDGTWDREPPTCTAHECDETEVDVLRGLEGTTVEIIDPSTRSISCDPCYKPTDTQYVSCTNYGQWSPSVKSLDRCQRRTCGSSGSPENGRVVNPSSWGYECGTSVTFVCDDGFNMSGESTARCSEDGNWDNVPPVCLQKECPALETVENALTTATHGGWKVTYVCKDGYEMFGDAVRECLNGTQWSGPGATSCKPKHCGGLNDIRFGSVNQEAYGLNGKEDTPGAVVRYTCIDNRYELNGAEYRECGKDGQWSYLPPTCDCIFCKDLDLPNGYVIRGKENLVGRSVKHICDNGYEIHPLGASDSRTCQANGEWSGEPLSCKRVTCGKPSIPEGGQLWTEEIKESYSFLEIVRIVCKPHKNRLSYTCLADGTWGGDVDKSCHLN